MHGSFPYPIHFMHGSFPCPIHRHGAAAAVDLRISCLSLHRDAEQVQEGGEADMNKAIDSASKAFEDGRWSGLQPRDRGRILNKVGSGTHHPSM